MSRAVWCVLFFCCSLSREEHQGIKGMLMCIQMHKMDGVTDSVSAFSHPAVFDLAPTLSPLRPACLPRTCKHCQLSPSLQLPEGNSSGHCDFSYLIVVAGVQYSYFCLIFLVNHTTFDLSCTHFQKPASGVRLSQKSVVLLWCFIAALLTLFRTPRKFSF